MNRKIKIWFVANTHHEAPELPYFQIFNVAIVFGVILNSDLCTGIRSRRIKFHMLLV